MATDTWLMNLAPCIELPDDAYRRSPSTPLHLGKLQAHVAWYSTSSATKELHALDQALSVADEDGRIARASEAVTGQLSIRMLQQ